MISETIATLSVNIVRVEFNLIGLHDSVVHISGFVMRMEELRN
jgi:hypothetical protein